MPPKKAVKKVEIADENVLNLKIKDKPVGFSVQRIKDEENDKALFNKVDIVQDSVANEVFDRPSRSLRYDPDELHRRMETFAEKLEKAVIKVAPEDAPVHSSAAEAKELIKVKFEKFVALVASRDFLSVLEKNKNEDIILSSNLLTDLAGAVEEKQEKKSPVVFLIGLAIGIIITYLLINR
jgi:hypothetical protein